MGSVVLDTVNAFFSHSSSSSTHPEHVFRDAQHAQTPPSPPTSSSRSTPSRIEASMSESAQRAPSSSATRTLTRDNTPTQPTLSTRAPSQASQQRSAARPASPPLAARTAPTLPDGQPGAPSNSDAATAPSTQIPAESRPPGRRKIKVRDLEHIQSFATENMDSFSEVRSRSRSRSRGADDESPEYEISEMKVEHVIEMVAGLLTKITTTNDRQHEHLHRQPPSTDSASHLNQQTSSVLAFHGKNVPSITILSYLSRINKYCPTSYEVFLSLLVYFDRMTERVNAGPMRSLREASDSTARRRSRASSSSSESASSDQMEGITATTPEGTQQATPPASGSMGTAVQQGIPGTPHSKPNQLESPSIPPEPALDDPLNLSHFFVVDSFNIHRLVIAGVTCASKFFSDIFYTNSRYAKVGGLPLAELNHLELQFLLLNDFRLSVPVEEIEAYGTMLVEFYAREVVAQQKAAQAMQMRSLSESSSESTATVRAVAS